MCVKNPVWSFFLFFFKTFFYWKKSFLKKFSSLCKKKIYADISVAAHFSNIASRTWENLRYLSSGPTVAPLLPHKNFIWNSVRKASASNSSLRQPSKAISAFLRKRGRFSVNFRDASRWAQTIERPQSEAECSQGERIAAARPDGDTVPVNFYIFLETHCLLLKILILIFHWIFFI